MTDTLAPVECANLIGWNAGLSKFDVHLQKIVQEGLKSSKEQLQM